MIPLYSLRVEEHAESDFKKPLFYDEPYSLLPLLKKELTGVDREHGGIVMLDTTNRVIGLAVLGVGSLTSVISEPREAIKTALALNACGIVKWHTHPSDNPEPSDADRNSHKNLSKACEAVGLRLIDNLILSRDGNLFSFETDAAAKEIRKKTDKREKLVDAARKRIATGKGSNKDVLACCERDYSVQVCKYDFPRDMRIDNCHLIIEWLTPIVESKRVKLKTRYRARIILAVVKESLDILQAGGEPPTVNII